MFRFTIAFVLLAASAASCRKEAPSAMVPPSARLQAEQAAQFSVLGDSGGSSAPETSRGSFAASAVPAPASASLPEPRPSVAVAQKLIRTGSLEIEVPDFAVAVEEAARTATSLGGYVSDRQSNDEGTGRRRCQITLRIPSERFDGAIGVLRKLGRVRGEGVQTQDVTRAYADLETRLRVKRETVARLRDILMRQTGKVTEVLAVEREIARVVEEIEQAEGERRYFDNQVSLSTLTLSLFEPAAIVTPGALDPIVSALRQSVGLMSESIGELIELVASGLPWLAAIYLTWRLIRWRRRTRP